MAQPVSHALNDDISPYFSAHDETLERPIQIEDKFLVAYEANPQFAGRTDFLEIIKTELSDVTPRQHNHRIALYGMGGIGKTQCALGYVHANRNEYDRIYWITAIDRNSLMTEYQRIANAARLYYLQNASLVDVVNSVLLWLREQQSWLLVIDNLDDFQVADRLLPENGPTKHTIITTRNPNADGIPAKPLEVPLLNPLDSIDLLSALSRISVEPGTSEERQATEIVRRLGYLPLAIEQAGAYVREVTADFSAFLDEYKRNHKKLHMWVPAGNRQYPKSIATTWSIFFPRLKIYPTKLLRLFSFLNPDGILIDFLVSGAEAFDDDFRRIICDRTERARALLELEKFSLIKWNRSNKSITVHRLVQMVVRDEMSNDESRSILNSVIDMFTEAFPKSVTRETRSLCREYQGQIIEPLTQMTAIRTLKSCVIRTRMGEFLREEGKYDDSERFLFQAAEIYTSLLGTENLETLEARHKLARTYQVQGRNEKAAEIEEDVLEKRKRILRDGHPDTLNAMHGLAQMYQRLGRTVEAAGIQEEVLKERRRILGDGHLDTLKAMNSLASIYMAQGMNTEAIKIQEEALEKWKTILGDEDPDTLKAMNSLALAYQAQGRNAVEVARIQKEVLEKRRRIFGDEHLDTIVAMHNLAWTYHQLEWNLQAAMMQEEVVKKWGKILGEEHSNTVGAMHNLASIYQAQGKNAVAAGIQEEVLKKWRRALGREHTDTLRAMNNLAWMYHLQERSAEAAEIQEEVVRKRMRILGDEHPATVDAMVNLGLMYQAMGNNEAVRILEEALQKQIKILGEEHPDTVTTMNCLVSMYEAQGNTIDAARISEVLDSIMLDNTCV